MEPKRPHAPRITIKVTEDIIAAAIPRDSSHCMIAEAVRCAFPTARRVAVDLQTIRFTDPDRDLRFIYLTPRQGQVALVNFDQGKLPEPFDMTLKQGQVTLANTQGHREKASRTPRQVEAARKSAATARTSLRRAVMRHEVGANTGGVPTKIGGKAPPLSGYAHRRAFGLRNLER